MSQTTRDLAEQVDEMVMEERRLDHILAVGKNEDFFYGDSIDHMVAHEGETEEIFQKKDKPRVNITKKIVNTFVGQIYGKPVIRSYDNDRNQKLMDRIMVENDGLSVQGREWQTMAELSGFAALVPRYNKKRDRFHVNAYTSAETFTFPSPADPKKLEAVVISYQIEDRFAANSDDRFIDVKEVYTEDEFELIHDSETARSADGKKIEGGHRFEEVPVAFMHADTDYRFFTPTPPANDVVEMHQQIEKFMKDFAEILKHQAFNVLFYRNPGVDEIVLDPGRIITSNNPAADLKSVQFQANLMNVADAIKFYLDLAADIGEIPSFWLSNSRAGVASGIALKILFTPAINAVARRVTGFRAGETKLWRLFPKLADQTIGRHDVSQEATAVAIDYSPFTIPVETTDQLAQDNWDLANGQITQAEILRRNNPEMSQKQAEEIVTENLAKNKANGIGLGPITNEEAIERARQSAIDRNRNNPPPLDVTV